jgi:hypothetical protein
MLTTSHELARPLPSDPAEPGATSPDISLQILASLDRDPGDLVRCTRVGPDFYRCNWWARHSVVGSDDASASDGLFTTHRVRKSQFLEATMTPTGLAIRIHSDAGLGVQAAGAAVRPHAHSVTGSR